MTTKTKALCIVAHPDDETIWMGGTILKHDDWDWTILCLCRKNDSDRMPKFKKVCSFYKAKAIISDLDDETLAPISTEEIIEKINKNLPEKEYDYIFTHGENGEYGHIRHKEIHKAVGEMISSGLLKCNKTYYFSYIPGGLSAPHDPELKIPIPNKDADLFVELDEEIYEDKVKLVTDVYGFQNGIFETLSCNKEEAFVNPPIK